MFLVICSLCLFVVVGATCFHKHFLLLIVRPTLIWFICIAATKDFVKCFRLLSLFWSWWKASIYSPSQGCVASNNRWGFSFHLCYILFFSEWKKLIWNYYPFNLKYGRALNSKTVNSQVVDTSLQGLSKMIQNFVEIRVAAKSLLLGIFARWNAAITCQIFCYWLLLFHLANFRFYALYVWVFPK